MKRLSRIIALVLCVIVLTGAAGEAAKKRTRKRSSPSPAPAVELITVEAEGVAPVVSDRRGEAKQAALHALRRDALDKAIGSFVSSVTKIENYKTVSDKVFAQANGLVKKVEVVREWVDENNMMHVVASCGVAKKALDGVLGPAVID
ncbi:MAG: hypothetical protein IJG37_06165, partial [Synergistaceae bacterium]|nr:hypothetical protein [Synergistaceae bacterium]